MFSTVAQICWSVSALKTCHSGDKSVGSLRDQNPAKTACHQLKEGGRAQDHLSLEKRGEICHSPNLAAAHCVRLQMLRIIFEGNKVHINDKTSQSSEESKDRKQSSTESSML